MLEMRVRTGTTISLLVIAVLLVPLGFKARSYLRAVSLVVRSAGLERQHPVLAALQSQPYREQKITIRSRYGALRARLYAPERSSSRAVVLTPGVNALSIDEPRLKSFARQLAATGLTVVTPALPDLERYQVTPREPDEIEDAARWLLERRDLTGGRPIGLMGISFAGGLSIVAASRPSIRDHLAFVFSFGGHGDFPRVLRFLCTGMEPVPESERARLKEAGKPAPREVCRKPHDYGVAIMLLSLADRLVPADQVEPLRRAILTFLHASHLALIDERQAEEVFEKARGLVGALPEPAATLMREVNDREVATLGPMLLPFIADMGGNPALSPEKSPPPMAPVYLLHGADDNVIPAAETLLLAEHLEGKTRVHALLSGLITHAEVDRSAAWSEQWRLAQFWEALLSE